MFKVRGEQTIPTTLTFTGQGQPDRVLRIEFKHIKRSDYAEQLGKIAEGEKTAEQVAVELVDSWEADSPVNLESMTDLDEYQPGTVWAIVTAYGDALRVAIKGN